MTDPGHAAIKSPENPQRRVKLIKISEEDLGIKVLYEPKDVGKVEVDIVAVHGLAAHPDKTWEYYEKPRVTEPASGTGNRTGSKPEVPVNWLRDPNMLPAAIPNARIMRYGYDSRWYGPNAVRQRLSNIANKMLLCLSDERLDCPNRPIIFIGHCFGGLVIQKAYHIAKSHAPDFPGIHKETIGVIFMGTPHQGTGKSLQSQGKIYQAVIYATLEGEEDGRHIPGKGGRNHTEEGILHSLEEDNEILVDVVREFTRIITFQPSLKIFCFFEQKQTIVGRIVNDDSITDFVVNETSGVLHGSRYDGLPLDHFHLNKFKSPKDGNFARVRSEIVRMVRESQTAAKNRRSSKIEFLRRPPGP